MKFLRFTDVIQSGFAANKRVFIRADLNVPQDDAGNITEDTRIRASIPCIELALKAGAAVMVTSHLGRPTEGSFVPADSLAPVAKRMAELMGREIPVIANWVDGVTVAPGQLVMLENCRVNKGEKKNDEALAKKMAACATSLSTTPLVPPTALKPPPTALPSLPPSPAPVLCWPPRWMPSPKPCWPPNALWSRSWLAQSLHQAHHPQSLAENVDQLIVGGGIANTFMLAAGLKIGKSLAETRSAGPGQSRD